MTCCRFARSFKFFASDNGMAAEKESTSRIAIRRFRSFLANRYGSASIRTRLQAIRLLMAVEGLPTSAKTRPVSITETGANGKRLKELLGMARKEKPEEGLSDAPASPLRQQVSTASAHPAPQRSTLFLRCPVSGSTILDSLGGALQCAGECNRRRQEVARILREKSRRDGRPFPSENRNRSTTTQIGT